MRCQGNLCYFQNPCWDGTSGLSLSFLLPKFDATNLAHLLEYAGRIHIGFDGWTSPNVISFLGVVIHIAHEGLLQLYLLDFIMLVRSWRWMSAHHMGLTGKAIQWAVRKQKGHCCASRTAMMHLDVVLNGS